MSTSSPMPSDCRSLALPMLAGTGAAHWPSSHAGRPGRGLVHLTGVLSGNRSPWRVAIAGLFLAPAVALAATQVYPDLISGFVMAIIIMIMATVELRLEFTTPRLVVVALSFVCCPGRSEKHSSHPPTPGGMGDPLGTPGGHGGNSLGRRPTL